MQYYIETIEQIYKDGAYSEYGGTEKVADETTALSKYYKKLSDVAADLGKNHTYLLIKIINSVGGEVKSDVIGQYVTEEAKDQ
jgi:hypothetical protein